MTTNAQSSDEDTTEQYSGSAHARRYGRTQYQFGLSVGGAISINWTGSARDLIREQIADDWNELKPRGVALQCFESHESVVQVRTLAQAKAIYQTITDELHRRRIDGRQRNSLHNARDQLVDEFESQVDDLVEMAGRTPEPPGKGTSRPKGSLPSGRPHKKDVALDAPIRCFGLKRARVTYRVGKMEPGWRRLDREEREALIAKAINEYPVIYPNDDGG